MYAVYSGNRTQAILSRGECSLTTEPALLPSLYAVKISPNSLKVNYFFFKKIHCGIHLSLGYAKLFMQSSAFSFL